MVDDNKLQALDHKIVAGDTVKVYGSKEDNEDALKSLSAIDITDEQSQEFFASMILKDLGKIPNVIYFFKQNFVVACTVSLSASYMLIS